MHEMQTVVTDVRGVCLSLCPSSASTPLRCAKTAERIRMLFVVNILGGPRNILLDGGRDPPQRGGIRCSLRQITLASVFECYNYD